MIQEEIKKERKEAGLSQANLAEEMSAISGAIHRPQQISDWERGVKDPRGKSLDLIAKALYGQDAKWKIDKGS